MVNTTGAGSATKKATLVKEMMTNSTPVEAKYVSRIVTGKLRLGASDSTVIDALSIILTGNKDMSSQLADCYGVDPDLGYLSHRVLSAVATKKNVTPEVKIGIPVRSRLVERVKEFTAVFERLGDDFYIQPKYDGIRCQIHKGIDIRSVAYENRVWTSKLEEVKDDSIGMFDQAEVQKDCQIKLFSRNLEDITEMFPDVVDAVSKFDSPSFILDGEVVGWDSDKEGFAPFQETMTRKRKYRIEEAKENVPVRYYAFDLLLESDHSLLDEDLEVRLRELAKLFKNPVINRGGDVGGNEGGNEALITYSTMGATKNADIMNLTVTTDICEMDQLEEEFNKAVGAGLEGIVAKKRSGGYQAGKRNFEWIKLKRSMLNTLVDSVDLVIMGYYYGSGRQTEFGMGALLGGVYDKDMGKMISTTKIGTGITDEQWVLIGSRLKKLETSVAPKEYVVSEQLKPDVWVLPEVVCTVEADEITRSKAHLAGFDQLGYGLALRFPRLIEFDRDKRPEDATSVEELIGLYPANL